jgi:galactose mutarotase-like enzyme
MPEQIYRLQDPTGLAQIEVVPDRGGILTRWQVAGKELLYLDQERFADPSLTVRGGIPILFPICGNLPENLYSYGGGTYKLKQHGFARDLPWQVQSLAADKIVLTLTSNAFTLSQYPFCFDLHFSYQVDSDRLILQQRVHNSGTTEMPFCIGFHPYFTVTDKTQLQLQIPAVQMVNQITQTLLPFGGSLDWSEPELDLAFRPLSAQTAVVMDPQRQLRLEMEFDPLYSTLVFWTVQGKDFFCLEPWSAPRNALNTRESLSYLAPGQIRQASFTLQAIFG